MTLTFDAAGQQVAVVDARGSINTTLYDGRGSVQATQDPLGALTSFQYDSAGNLGQRTDARGRVTTYTADALGRTVGMLYTAGSRVTFTFDPAGQQLTMQDSTGITTSTYDNAGRQTSVAHPIGKNLTYGYDANGSRVLLTDPDGGLTTYAYDANLRLTRIVNPYAEVTTITHDALDREDRKTLANGMVVSHLYDPAGREIALVNWKADGTPITAHTSDYDAVGNRVSVRPTPPGDSGMLVLGIPGVAWGSNVGGDEVVRFAYDSSYQLINEQREGANGYNTTYVYDQVGNRLQKVNSGAITTYGYNAANEQVLITPPTGQPTTISYDENGNTLVENTGGQLTTSTWDDENRLVGITKPDASLSTFAYAADGLRRRKETPTEVRQFVWDRVNVLQEVDAALSQVAQYTDFPGEWGGLVAMRRDGTSSFYGFDPMANTRVLVFVGGVVTDSYTYKAFGEEWATSGSSANPLRFGGRFDYWRDAADRLHVGPAILRPEWGRWLAEVQVRGGDRAGGDYAYAGNHPSGRAPELPDVPRYVRGRGCCANTTDRLLLTPWFSRMGTGALVGVEGNRDAETTYVALYGDVYGGLTGETDLGSLGATPIGCREGLIACMGMCSASCDMACMQWDFCVACCQKMHGICVRYGNHQWIQWYGCAKIHCP